METASARQLGQSHLFDSVVDVDLTYFLFMLGTDTEVEATLPSGGSKRLSGYERGEVLNAIVRKLKGIFEKDKHIVSGPDTLGSYVYLKVAEGVLMVLKAISEGKRKIKIAGHSRGGIEEIMIAHVVDKLLKRIKRGDKNVDDIAKIILNPPLNSDIDKPIESDRLAAKGIKELKAKQDKGKMEFELTQTDELNKTGTPKKIEIDLEKLKENILKSDPPIKCQLFIIDPVPGQHLLSTSSNWTLPEFFEIPEIVERIELYYMRNERSNYFEPVLPFRFPLDCIVRFICLPGYHGTASGGLDQQDPSKTVIGSDVPRDEHKGIGKKTRAVQKLMAMYLVDYLRNENFKTEDILPLIAESSDPAKKEIPSIEHTISKYLKLNEDAREEAKLKQYEKIYKNLSEFEKLNDHNYKGLGRSGKRKALTSDSQGRITTVFFSDFMHDASFGRFVNMEHFELSLSKMKKKVSSSLTAEHPIFKAVIENFEYAIYAFEHPNDKEWNDDPKNTRTFKEAIDAACKRELFTSRFVGFYQKLIDSFIDSSLKSALQLSENDFDIEAVKSVSQQAQRLIQLSKEYAVRNGNLNSHVKLYQGLSAAWESTAKATRIKAVEDIQLIKQELETAFHHPDKLISEKLVLINDIINRIGIMKKRLSAMNAEKLLADDVYRTLISLLDSQADYATSLINQLLDQYVLSQSKKLKFIQEAATDRCVIATHARHTVSLQKLEASKKRVGALAGKEFNHAYQDSIARLTEWDASIRDIQGDSRDELQDSVTDYDTQSASIKAENKRLIDEFKLAITTFKDRMLLSGDFTNKLLKLHQLSEDADAVQVEMDKKTDDAIAAKKVAAKACQGGFKSLYADALRYQETFSQSSTKSYDVQCQRLESLMPGIQHDPLVLHLASVVSQAVKKKVEKQPTQKDMFAKTLYILNEVLDPSVIQPTKPYLDLFTEGDKFYNSDKEDLKIIAWALLAIGIILTLGIIATSILTFGFGLVATSIFFTVLGVGGTASIASYTLSAMSFLSSRQPEVYREMKSYSQSRIHPPRMLQPEEAPPPEEARSAGLIQ